MATWDPGLETGVAEIDDQHRALFDCATRLVEAVRSRRTAEVAEAIRFLVDYVRDHFAAEERLMRESGYPGLADHAELHRRITRRLGEVVAAHGAHGGSDELAGDVDAMMRGWVSIHIAEKDRAFVEFLRERAAG